jgi:hypothetical protein
VLLTVAISLLLQAKPGAYCTHMREYLSVAFNSVLKINIAEVNKKNPSIRCGDKQRLFTPVQFDTTKC